MRGIKFTTVVFPEPVGPTMARLEPGGILRLMFVRTRLLRPAPLDEADGDASLKLKSRLRNSMSPRRVTPIPRRSGETASSVIVGFSVMISLMRAIDAVPR